jgi:hypothetical protein
VTIDVVTSIVIRRARSEVAAYAANPDHVPQWYVNIRSVEWKTPPPATIGSQVAFVAQFLGRRLAYTYEAVDPPWPPSSTTGNASRIPGLSITRTDFSRNTRRFVSV